jgi:hypothetical protein
MSACSTCRGGAVVRSTEPMGHTDVACREVDQDPRDEIGTDPSVSLRNNLQRDYREVGVPSERQEKLRLAPLGYFQCPNRWQRP